VQRSGGDRAEGGGGGNIGSAVGRRWRHIWRIFGGGGVALGAAWHRQRWRSVAAASKLKTGVTEGEWRRMRESMAGAKYRSGKTARHRRRPAAAWRRGSAAPGGAALSISATRNLASARRTRESVGTRGGNLARRVAYKASGVALSASVAKRRVCAYQRTLSRGGRKSNHGAA